MENRWTERIALAIVMSMIGLFIGSYTDVGKFSVRLDYIENDLDTKIDNKILIEWMKSNKEDMKAIIKDIESNEKELHELRERLHEIELRYVGINVTRDYMDTYDWNYENLISFEWQHYNEIYDE